MSKKIFILIGLVLLVIFSIIFLRNKTDKWNKATQTAERNSYVYTDGNANAYWIHPASMTIEYDPITTAESSSGMYSGGAYVKKAISRTQFDALAILFERAAQNKTIHIQDPVKGSGVMTITTGMEIKEFILDQDAAEKVEIEKMLKELVKK